MQTKRHGTAGSNDGDKALSDKDVKDPKKEVSGWIFSLLAAVIIALLLRFFVFEFIRVDGESMTPTLQNEEYVFMERVTYWFSEPQRGDIVICHFPNSEETYVKRVIGVGGDTLRVTDGVLYINGEANTDYFKDRMNRDMKELTVPEGYVFVMGDNRNNSTDSRVVGALSLDMILGKALFVIWPPANIGGL
jgi:signal peptidase I